jgi:hypothetical protein
VHELRDAVAVHEVRAEELEALGRAQHQVQVGQLRPEGIGGLRRRRGRRGHVVVVVLFLVLVGGVDADRGGFFPRGRGRRDGPWAADRRCRALFPAEGRRARRRRRHRH